MLSKSSRDSTRIFLDGFRGILSRHFKDGGLGFPVKWITVILEGLIEVVDVIGVVRDIFLGGGAMGDSLKRIVSIVVIDVVSR